MKYDKQLYCLKCNGYDIFCHQYTQTPLNRQCGWYNTIRKDLTDKLQRQKIKSQLEARISYGTQRDIKYFGGDDE